MAALRLHDLQEIHSVDRSVYLSVIFFKHLEYNSM